VKFGRLVKNKEFQLVYKKGQSYVGRHMVLYVLPRPNANSETRVGFTVGKKVGGSVQRNRVRRRLKEIYRWLKPRIALGYDLVIVARPRALEAEFNVLQEEMMYLCKKAKLLVREARSGD
jgi:ribonuclease P protein component